METSIYKEEVWKQLNAPSKKSWRIALKQLFSDPINRSQIDALRKENNLIAAYEFGVYSGKSIVEIANNIVDIEVIKIGLNLIFADSIIDFSISFPSSLS